MDKLSFDTDTFLFKTNLGSTFSKVTLLNECSHVIASKPYVTLDGYTYREVTNDSTFMGSLTRKSTLDSVLQKGIELCTSLYTQSGSFSYINLESWINIVKAKNPAQDILNKRYHSHTEINKNRNAFIPTYTFVYYIQMPNNLSGDEGVLFLASRDNKEYTFLPQEGDLVILKGDQLHGPNIAPNSSLDRYVLAGNLEFVSIKNKNTLI